MTHRFTSFAEFVEHARVAAEACYGQMREAGISEENCAAYRRMRAELAISWLERAGDFVTLALLRDRITNALKKGN